MRVTHKIHEDLFPTRYDIRPDNSGNHNVNFYVCIERRINMIMMSKIARLQMFSITFLFQ